MVDSGNQHAAEDLVFLRADGCWRRRGGRLERQERQERQDLELVGDRHVAVGAGLRLRITALAQPQGFGHIGLQMVGR